MGFLVTSGGLKGKPLNWAITAASCQAFLLLGYDQGNHIAEVSRSLLNVEQVLCLGSLEPTTSLDSSLETLIPIYKASSHQFTVCERFSNSQAKHC